MKNPKYNWNINRYLHAERDTKGKCFQHFDGAVKIYPKDGYRERLKSKMPNNTRPKHYIKLFRVDSNIDLENWTHMISTFFKGKERK